LRIGGFFVKKTLDDVGNGENPLFVEKEWKLLFRYATPCVLALLISAFYNVVDQLFIGNSRIGSLGNAATTVVYPLTIFALALALLLGDGAAAFLSLGQGKKDTKDAGKAIAGSITLGLIVSIVFSLTFTLALDPVLTLLGASVDSLPLAHSYGLIICLGIVFSIFTNLLNPIIRSDGSPIFAMIAQGSGALLNIALDPLFIYVFDLGVEGAAYATIIGQFLSALLSVIYLCKPKTFSFSFKDLLFGMKELGKSLKLGISSFFIQMSLFAVTIASNIILSRCGASSEYGADTPIAVFGIVYKVFTIVINIPIGISLGALPIIGCNYGAGNYKRVKMTYLWVFLASLVVTSIATIWFETAPMSIISLFGSNEGELYYEFGVRCLRIYLSCLILTGIQRTSSVFFQAIGKPLQATILSLSRDLVLLLPLSFMLSSFYGIDGFLYSAPIADCVAFIISLAMMIWGLVYLNKKETKAETVKQAAENC
jgi:putative MATE family efflux protein